MDSKDLDNKPLRNYLGAYIQGVKRLFVFVFDNIDNSDKKVEKKQPQKIFFTRVNISNYNLLIDSRNFYNQPVGDQIKKYDEIRRIATIQWEDYTTGCLLVYQYFKDHYQLIAVKLRKQKKLDADPIAIQQIKIYGMLDTKPQVCTIVEKTKEAA